MHAEKCPVCLGCGLVSDGFYDQCSGHWSSIGCFETCRSCNGKGWIAVQDNLAMGDTVFVTNVVPNQGSLDNIIKYSGQEHLPVKNPKLEDKL